MNVIRNDIHFLCKNNLSHLALADCLWFVVPLAGTMT